MSDERPKVQPSFGALVSNWRSSDLWFGGKLRQALGNSWTKLRRRENCCGNLGQPGC